MKTQSRCITLPVAILVVTALLFSGCLSQPPRKRISIKIKEDEEPRAPKAPIPAPEPEIVQEGDRTVCFYPCANVYGEEIKRILDEVATTETTVMFSRPLNMVVFSDPKPEVVASLLKYAQKVDVYQPQILVEAKIVEFNVDDDFEFELSSLFDVLNPTRNSKLRQAEITLSTPGTNPSAEGFGGTVVHLGKGTDDTGQLTNFIRLLVTEGKAEILSSPNLIVSAGNTASIITGEEVPVTNQTAVSGAIQTSTVFKRVGVKLRVTPMQITNDMVYVEVNPEVSTVIGYTSGETSNPIVAVRNTSTTLKVKDNELIAIGGLLREEDRILEKKIPVLSSIPVLGRIFRATRHEKGRTQLVFFLRIQILPESETGAFSVPEQGLPDERLDQAIDIMRGTDLEKLEDDEAEKKEDMPEKTEAAPLPAPEVEIPAAEAPVEKPADPAPAAAEE